MASATARMGISRLIELRFIEAVRCWQTPQWKCLGRKVQDERSMEGKMELTS